MVLIEIDQEYFLKECLKNAAFSNDGFRILIRFSKTRNQKGLLYSGEQWQKLCKMESAPRKFQKIKEDAQKQRTMDRKQVGTVSINVSGIIRSVSCTSSGIEAMMTVILFNYVSFRSGH